MHSAPKETIAIADGQVNSFSTEDVGDMGGRHGRWRICDAKTLTA
jgi:hypothetical protein